MERNRNKKSKGRTVSYQFTKVKYTKINYSGERSPHWDWTQRFGWQTPDGEYKEDVRANPDSVVDEDQYRENRAFYEELIEKLFKILSSQEKKLFGLLQTNKTEREVAAIMKISQPRVNQIRNKMWEKLQKIRYQNPL